MSKLTKKKERRKDKRKIERKKKKKEKLRGRKRQKDNSHASTERPKTRNTGQRPKHHSGQFYDDSDPDVDDIDVFLLSVVDDWRCIAIIKSWRCCWLTSCIVHKINLYILIIAVEW